MRNYEVKPDGTTHFTLEKGTKIAFGSQIITLEGRAEVSIKMVLSEAAVMETIESSGRGNLAANLAEYATEETANTVEVFTEAPRLVVSPAGDTTAANKKKATKKAGK